MHDQGFFKYLLSIFLIFFSISSTLAQETDTLDFNTTLTLGGMRKAGVFSQTNVNASLSTIARKSKWTFDNQTTYTYTIVNGNELSNDWTVVSKLGYQLAQQPIAPTFLHVYKNNLLYRIQHSQRYILGASVTPLTDRKQFWFFIGGGYERTIYNGNTFENSPLTSNQRNFGMTTLYIENTHHLIQDKLFLKYSLFYIQSVEEWSDYTFWIIPSLNITINKNLIFAVSYDYRFRNIHLVDIPSFNELMTFNIKISIDN